MNDLSLTVEGAVARLWLERPKQGNALTPEMMAGMVELIAQAQEQGAKVLVVRGRVPTPEGGTAPRRGAFCSGYDLKRLAESFRDGVDAGGQALQDMLDAVEGFEGSTVAMLDGPAIGGGVLLALACDLRFGHDRAHFRIPVARLGLIYPLRGLRALVGAVGSGRALEILHTGRDVSAVEAERWGLLNATSVGGSWEQAAESAIAAMAKGAPLSLRGHHRLVRDLVHGRLDLQAAEALAQEALRSEDAREGAFAIVEKRTPNFSGR